VSSHLEFPILDKQGREIWVGQTVDFNYTDFENGEFEVTSLSRDITERKNMEQQLFQAKETAEDSVRSKELFMANMSHEIRTPMNAIIGMGELLRKSPLNKKQNEFLEAINTSSENLLIIINDILDFSKIEAGKLEMTPSPTNLQLLLENCIKTIELKAEEKGISLHLNIPQKIDWYSVDATRLRQVILNLLSNAVKFTPAGSVLLSSKVLKDQPKSSTILFSVKDTGIGIAKDKVSNIFESFIQADESTAQKYGGTGLGLSISKQLVEMMGGQLEINSELNEGSEFYFTITLEKSESYMPVSQNQNIKENTTLTNMKVLLVEDHEINRFMAQTILENWECKVDIAVNGKEATEKITSSSYDVVLMDMRMPEMDGLEATKFIREILKVDVPIIGLTANAIRGDKEKCLKIGMNDYISKPFKQKDLFSKMSKFYSNPDDTQESPSIVTDPLMDLTKLIETTNNDPVFMKKMINLFIEDTPEQLATLQSAAKKKDWIQVSKIAHKLKPSIDYLSNAHLQRLVRSIENVSDIENYKEIQVNTLVNDINNLIVELKTAA